jgi:hypothetical protein
VRARRAGVADFAGSEAVVDTADPQVIARRMQMLPVRARETRGHGLHAAIFARPASWALLHVS